MNTAEVSLMKGVLLLDADTQTEELVPVMHTPQPDAYGYEISSQISEVHIDLITRVNELEMQTSEVFKKLNCVCFMYFE